MGNKNNKESKMITKENQGAKLSDYFGAQIKDSRAFLFKRTNNRLIARLLVSDIVPLQDNRKFIVSVIYRYADYLKGDGKKMEIKSNKIIDVHFEQGVATLFDKRTGQTIAQLRFDPRISLMDTVSFISAVMEDYERYLKLVTKYYGG